MFSSSSSSGSRSREYSNGRQAWTGEGEGSCEGNIEWPSHFVWCCWGLGEAWHSEGGRVLCSEFRSDEASQEGRERSEQSVATEPQAMEMQWHEESPELGFVPREVMPLTIRGDITEPAAVVLAPDGSIFAESKQLCVWTAVGVSRLAYSLNLDDLRRQLGERLLRLCVVGHHPPPLTQNAIGSVTGNFCTGPHSSFPIS